MTKPVVLTDEQASNIAQMMVENWKVYGQDFIEDVRFIEAQIAAIHLKLQPAQEPIPRHGFCDHPDDEAAERFCAKMKYKLGLARQRGKSGWNDPNWTPEMISQALREHVEKGDPVDVANYCMFLAARKEPICAAPQPVQETVGKLVAEKLSGNGYTATVKTTAFAQPVQKPVAWMYHDNAGFAQVLESGPHPGFDSKPLYAAPVQPVQSPPPEAMTDEQIEKLREKTFSTNNPFCPVDSKSMRKAIRAYEAAIKGAKP